MNNLIANTKKGILITAMVASVMGYANESIDSDKKDAKKTALVLNNVKQGNLLTIKDNYGIILYKESIKTDGTYKKGFDLSDLPDGNYVFEVEKDLEIRTIPFKVTSKEVLLEKENVIFKPYSRVKEDMLYISKLALDGKALDISIYANDNGVYELLHSEKVAGELVIERKYRLEKESYKIVLHSDNKEYTKFIN